LPSPKKTRNASSWRGDATWIWVALIQSVVLVAVSATLIALFRGAGFWPWLIMAGAIVLGWVSAVVILIPRSAPRR
jgi:hypothetical protein